MITITDVNLIIIVKIIFRTQNYQGIIDHTAS